MKHDIALPRWVQLTLAWAYLAVPVTAAAFSLAGNIHYNMQFGLASMAVFGAADVARIVLPVMAALIFGWNTMTRLVMVAVAVACAYTAINYVSDSRFQDLFTRSEVSSTYTDSKVEIERLVTALSNIRETSTPAALEGQIATKTTAVADLQTLVEDHSNPKKRGPCKDTCEGYKKKLAGEQVALGLLQERLGQANTKLELTAQLRAARTTKSTVASEVRDGGIASVLAWAGVSSKGNLDMGTVFASAILYLLLVEGLCYLMPMAIVCLLSIAYAKREEDVVVEEAATEEDVQWTRSSLRINLSPEGVISTEETAPVAFVPTVLSPVAEVEETTVEPVVATAEPEVVAEPIVEATPIKRRRDQFGRFAKKKKLPAKKAPKAAKPKAKAVKLKLKDLPRPVGENVIDLVARGKLTKD